MTEHRAKNIQELLKRQGLGAGSPPVLPSERSILEGEVPTAPTEQPPQVLSIPPARAAISSVRDIRELLAQQGIDPESRRQLGARKVERVFGTGAAQIETLRQMGVDVETGGPAGVRARLALTPPERRQRVLEEEFPLGFTETDVGTIINVPDGTGGMKQLLLDEEGLALGDFADAAAEGIIVGGSVLAAAAVLTASPAIAAGGVLSLALLAVITGVAGQASLGAAEVIGMLTSGGVDLDVLTGIAKRRGVGAAIDATLDFISAGTFRFLRGVGQKIIAPSARRLAETPKPEILAAADRLDVTLSPGEQVGGGLLRAETIAERVPGAEAPVRALRRATSEQISRAEQRLTEGVRPAAEVGPEIVQTLEAQRVAKLAAVEDLRVAAAAATERKLAEVQANISRRSFSLDEAGEAVRTKLQDALAKFKLGQKRLEAGFSSLIQALPEEARAFLPTRSLKVLATKLENEFPKREIVEEVSTGVFSPETKAGVEIFKKVTRREGIPELFPAAARRIISGIKKLPERITFEEARNVRQTLSAMIDGAAAFPGVSVGMLKALEAEFTNAIKAGVKNAPTKKIGVKLTELLENFKEEVVTFRSQPVARALRTPEQVGFIEGQDVLPNLMLSSKVETAKRVLKVIGTDSAEAGLARRSAFDEMLRRSQDTLLGDGFIDPSKLAAQFDSLTPAARALIFGKDVKTVRRLVRLLAARHGLVNVSGVLAALGAPGERKILGLLRQAAKQEAEAARLFDTRVLRPFLAGVEKATAPSPEEFIRFFVRGATPTEIKGLFKLLPEAKVNDFRKVFIQRIIEKSSDAATDPEAQAVALLAGKGGVGLKLARMLEQTFGETISESLGKVRTILTRETIGILEDLALVQSARGQAAAAAKAVGGLVGGSIIASFLDFQIGTGFRIIKARIVSGMLTSAPIRAWLTSTRRIDKHFGRKFKAYELALPQILRLVTAELGEVSPEAQALSEFFTKDVPEMLGLLTDRKPVVTRSSLIGERP